MSQAVAEPDASPAELASHPLVQQVRSLVARNSRRWRLLTLLEGCGLVVSAILAYLWLVFWLDTQWHLPSVGRWLASGGLLVGLGMLANHLLQRSRALRYSEDQVALAIERRTPGAVQNRLINALQLARSSTNQSLALSHAVIAENVSNLQRLELEQAAALRPALLRVAGAIGLVIVGAAFYQLQPERFSNAAARILFPFVDVAPLYRTTLAVSPGDIEAVGDIRLAITISGERPRELVLLTEVDGRQTTVALPVDDQAETVEHTLRGVQQTLRYAVRGGDYVTRYYQITVPTPSNLSLLSCVYQLPAYTRQGDQRTESVAGNLEALRGTLVDLTFQFDQPCDAATLLIERLPLAAADAQAEPSVTIDRLPLQASGPARFTGRLALTDQTAYRIETQQPGRAPHVGKPYAIRVIADAVPKLELTGLTGKAAVDVAAVLPYRVVATDDWGLAELALVMRRAPLPKASSEWQTIATWSPDGKAKFEQSAELSLAALAVAEGERLEFMLRGKDRDPAKADHWTDGEPQMLNIGGEAAALQLLYEQILRTEAELKQLHADQRRAMLQTVDWLRKLDGEGGWKGNDPQNLAKLHASVAVLNQQQAALRERAGGTARAMVAEAGSLQLSVGLLADTEMVRAERILDSVATREVLQAKRAALADAQLTAQRTLTSLQQILEQYVTFRQDWELNHLTGFVKMLAERQAALGDSSLARARPPTAQTNQAPQPPSGVRRQEKLVELVRLAEVGLMGLSDKLTDLGAPLSAAFATAGESLSGEALATAFEQSLAALEANQWAEAATAQAAAAAQLTAIHDALRKAQLDAARETLSALEEQAKSDLAAQQALEKLKAGQSTSEIQLPEKLPVKDLIEMRNQLDINKKGGNVDPIAKVTDYLLTKERAEKILNPADSGKRQAFDILKLGSSVGAKTPSFPGTSDRESNLVKAPIQEELKDLVGALLEEADEMQAKFETSTLNTSFNINEAGEVGKLGGDMNSTAAAATTGNKKPPTRNVGGASRSGRRGARAHGIVVGDESVNRRGRDKVQEGQERVADQEGTIRETKSDDPQNDTSTGVGGKRVESDDTKFSVADAGKWTDDMARRMGKPQEKNYIVERQDGRMDPQLAEMLQDLTSDREQIIERVKAIRKELKNLYLPTDHLDEILAELQGQLDRLKQRPTAELFRLERQTLDKLRGTLRVFHQAQSNFQPSLPREQVVRGRVRDDADRPPPPGYESQVKRYYELLSRGEAATP